MGEAAFDGGEPDLAGADGVADRAEGQVLVVAERSEPAWVELRGALANERFAAQYGEEQDPAARTLLAITRADAQVAAARTGLDTNLTYLTASWNSALEP